MQIRPNLNKVFLWCNNTLELTNVHGLLKYFKCSTFLTTHCKVYGCGGRVSQKSFPLLGGGDQNFTAP